MEKVLEMQCCCSVKGIHHVDCHIKTHKLIHVQLPILSTYVQSAVLETYSLGLVSK